MVSSRLRRWLYLGGALLLAAGILLLTGGVAADRFMQSDPRFCGTCHAMQTPLQLWAKNEHRNVACQVCHQATRRDGLRMLWGMVSGAAPRKDHARVSSASCQSCHNERGGRWPRVAASPGHRGHRRGGVACLECHAVSLHSARPTVGACARCHVGRKVVAAGMESLHCLACHDFHSASEALTPGRPDCLRCHRSRNLAGHRFPVDAPMAFRCSACHTPHRAEAGIAVTCVTCHAEERLDGLHLRHAGAESRCVNCHRPHEWRFSREDCARCHSQADTHAEGKTCTDCHTFRERRRLPAPAPGK